MRHSELLENIYEMLTENTGRHMLDSGSIYGRNFERNANKSLQDFIDEPAEIIKKSGEYYKRTVSVFHYINSLGLSLDHICRNFNEVNINSNNWDAECDAYGVSLEAWEYLTEFNDVKISRTFNTYNSESDLSQILQGSWLSINGNTYLLLQIHGGCDARGGYTDARLFLHDENECDFLPEYKTQEEILQDIEEGAEVN